MLTFKNRFAEYDNLDDSYNQNVFNNCYHREYRKNFFRGPKMRNQNNRYNNNNNNNERYVVNKSENYSNGYFNNNSNINNFRESSYTPSQAPYTPYQNSSQIKNLFNNNNNNNDLFSKNLNSCNSAVLINYDNNDQQYNNNINYNNNGQQYNNNVEQYNNNNIQQQYNNSNNYQQYNNNSNNEQQYINNNNQQYNNNNNQYNNNNNQQYINNNINNSYNNSTSLSSKFNNISYNMSNDNINNNYLENSNNSINESQIPENLNYNRNNNNNNENLNSSRRYDLNLTNESTYNYSNNNKRIRNYSNSVDAYNNRLFDINDQLNRYNEEQEILKGQEEIDKIENELKNIRQKRVDTLNKKLSELQKLQRISNLSENNLDRNIKQNNKKLNDDINRIKYTLNNNYNHGNYSRRVNNSYDFKDKSNFLKEEINSNLTNDKLCMDELIQEVNRLKLSQIEANKKFQKKMDDLAKQNENIQKVNEKMINKIKDMKHILNEKKQTNEYIQKYMGSKNLQQQKYIPPKKIYRNEYSNTLNNYENESQTINTNRRKNNFADYGNNIISEDYLDYDKDVKRLLYDPKKNGGKDNSLLYPYDKINGGDNIDGVNGRNSCQMELYNILRTDNGRLQRIKEIDENN